jgi:hypothetical protein
MNLSQLGGNFGYLSAGRNTATTAVVGTIKNNLLHFSIPIQPLPLMTMLNSRVIESRDAGNIFQSRNSTLRSNVTHGNYRKQI